MVKIFETLHLLLCNCQEQKQNTMESKTNQTTLCRIIQYQVNQVDHVDKGNIVDQVG